MIKIYSTSFINSLHQNWKKIESKIEFENYSEWSKFSNDIYNQKVVVIFEKDLGKKKNINFNFFFNIFKKALNNSHNKILVTYISDTSTNINDTVLSDRRNLKNTKDLFLKKIKPFFNFKNFTFFDMDKIFANFGTNEMFDDRNWYLFRSRLSDKGLGVLIDQLKRSFKHIKNLKKKLLILDCDNTLWGGVVGEDGYNKINIGEDGIGSAFKNFQLEIKNIKKTGILLAICSKNNYKDAKEVFKKNKNMSLKFDDFIIKKINWNEKYKNIREIKEELNIGYDSMVFWDDNILERKKIRKFLPDVLVPEPSEDVSYWSKELQNIDDLYRHDISEDDLKKNNQYKIRAKFYSSLKMKKDETSFLKSINPRPKIIQLSKDYFNRASQLTLKVNQFNLTSLRCDLSDIKKISKLKDHLSFLVEFKDNFGDHGLVALIILQRKDKNKDKTVFFIKNFSMSCRIIGRHLEAWILNEIVKIAKRNKVKFIESVFIKDKKNQLCENYYDEHGMKIVKKDKNKKTYLSEIEKIKVPYLEIYK